MKRHESHESSDLVRLQRKEDILTRDSTLEFDGGVTMSGSQPRCQELSACDTAPKNDAKGRRSSKNWTALRVERPLGNSARDAELWIRSE